MLNHSFMILSLSFIFLFGLWALTIFRVRSAELVERERMIHDTQEREKDRQLQRQIMKVHENNP
jgi:hypothetical protein